MADWTKPFTARYVWKRVPRLSYKGGGSSGYSHGTGRETESVKLLAEGTIETNSDTATFESGTAYCLDVPDLGTDLLRCHLLAEFYDGTTEDVVLGTFLPNVPSKDLGSRTTVKLDGRLMELRDDAFYTPRTIARGVDCGSYAQLLCWERGITTTYPFPVTGIALGTSWALGFDEESGNVLSTVNELLRQAGMRSASTDEYGRVRLRLPVDYGSAPVWTFAEGENATFLRTAKDERDASSVCNVVKVTYETNESTTVGYAEDTTSEWSIASLGRRKVGQYKYNDTATQTQANAKALELLNNQLSVVRRVTLTHVWCGARTGDVVEVNWPSQGIYGKFAIRKQEIGIGSAGCLCTSELRRFERG